uniref:Uncharacterized protein n=1 Tax=Escherichia phage UFV-AREG1 TaxID=1837867 RepID=A0A173GA99_9CAUD
MSLSKEQKDRLFSLIHEVMDKNNELEKVCDESDYGDAETYYELVKSIDKAENDLETYLENLTKD